MKRLLNIFILLFSVLALWAQSESIVVDTTSSAAIDMPAPEIEYTLTRNTYEIAGIEVEGPYLPR